jgi:hypothetical protein
MRNKEPFMGQKKCFRIVPLTVLGIILFWTGLAKAAENVPKFPRFYLNGQPSELTVQDLSGLGTRPLRLLIRRNNKARGEDWIRVHALGAREGDDLRVAFESAFPGMRVTLYKILRAENGLRYLSMPDSVYFKEPGEKSFQEKIEPFREEFFIIVFEKTDSPDEKDINVRYFEDRVRNLVIGSYKTNWNLSSLKLKLKDFADDQAKDFYERDAQTLIDRLIHPSRIFLIRIWKAGRA